MTKTPSSPTLRRQRIMRPLLAVASGLSLALLVIAVGASYFVVRQSTNADAWVTHSLEVENRANALWAHLVEAESATRAFVLTGEPTFSQARRQASAAFEDDLARLRILVRKDSVQEDRLDKIGTLAKRRLQSLKDAAGRAASGAITGSVGSLSPGQGLQLMSQLRDAVADFEAQEMTLLRARRQAASQARRDAETLTAIAAFLALLSGIFAAWLVRCQIVGMRASAVVLESRVAERTAELDAAKREAETAAARATREQSRVELLLRDLNHRVGNNLATISALLGLQLNRLPAGPAREAVESARERVAAIASAQRRLRLDHDLETVQLDTFLQTFVEDLRETLPNDGRIAIAHDFEPLTCGSRDAITLSVVLNELLTNAIKHAFPGGRRGTIAVSFALNSKGTPVLTVADDGVGLDAGTKENGTGLGSTIVDRMSQQYGGKVRREANPPRGTRVSVILPSLSTQRIVTACKARA
jgi:two-component sensor histidine kinase/CHASE3 domain sensor protein